MGASRAWSTACATHTTYQKATSHVLWLFYFTYSQTDTHTHWLKQGFNPTSVLTDQYQFSCGRFVPQVHEQSQCCKALHEALTEGVSLCLEGMN